MDQKTNIHIILIDEHMLHTFCWIDDRTLLMCNNERMEAAIMEPHIANYNIRDNSTFI